MRKKLVLGVLIAGMALTLSACTGPEGETSGEETAQNKEDPGSGEETSTPEPEDEAVGNTRLVSVEDIQSYINLGPYRDLELSRTVQEITREDVDLRIRMELEANREEVTGKDETVQVGDQVTINFVGTMNGEAFEGGTGNNYDLVIGEGSMIDGFEDGIVGMKKGETRDVPLTFPEDYEPTLAGKDVNFQITLLSFARTPEFTEEWVKNNTTAATVQAYRSQIRKQLEDEAAQSAETELTGTAWNMVWSSSQMIEYPQKDIDNFINQYKKINEMYAAQAGMTLEELIEAQGYTEENFEKDCQQYAEYVVKQNLIVQGIMDAEGLSLSDPECLDIQKDLMQEYGASDLNELIDTYGKESVDQSVGLIRVENFIVEHAVITDLVANGDMVGVNENGVTEDEASENIEDTTMDSGEYES